jgi:putative transposase
LGKEEEPMHDWQSLTHVRWDCKYHVVIVPKYRKKELYGKRRKRIGDVLRDLCRQRGVELLEGHLMPDHVHMCLRIAPKFSVALVIGFLKGKSAVRIHRQILRHKRVTGMHFWARGYCVSTVGLDEETIRRYIREQEDIESDQPDLDLE